MNLTQNDRLKQVTSETLIVGVDVGSQTHFCRAFYGYFIIILVFFSHFWKR